MYFARIAIEFHSNPCVIIFLSEICTFLHVLFLHAFPTAKAAESTSTLGGGELEITPVSAAIARHLGIDLSVEGKAARNRRGIAVIVHGAPCSG